MALWFERNILKLTTHIGAKWRNAGCSLIIISSHIAIGKYIIHFIKQSANILFKFWVSPVFDQPVNLRELRCTRWFGLILYIFQSNCNIFRVFNRFNYPVPNSFIFKFGTGIGCISVSDILFNITRIIPFEHLPGPHVVTTWDDTSSRIRTWRLVSWWRRIKKSFRFRKDFFIPHITNFCIQGFGQFILKRTKL
jgi:hypothetical protein